MATTVDAPFVYTEVELRSYLPPGWNLAGAPLGRWDPRKGRWSVRVEDTADVRWDLEIDARDVDEKGRHEALRLAVDRLHRNRLGKRTRGLGF
ncbi:MAG TPA: hypothetical protein VMR44_00625 [Thermoanaerobaculia bacterium]|jgi:hypothetical protein|nr:hypothetical protein [Thermoanaerobaculia bacterium]